MPKHKFKKISWKNINKLYLIKILCAVFLLILAISLFINGVKIMNTRLIYYEKTNAVKDEIITADNYTAGFQTAETVNPERTYSGEAAGLSPTVKPTAKPVANNPTAVPVPTSVVQPTAVVPTSPPLVIGNCPSSTQNCVPCTAGELYCRVEPGKTTGYKGWACQNNNPGNIRYSSYRIGLITGQGGSAPCGLKPLPDGYMVFTDYNSGYNALKAYIKAINAGQHSAYPECGNCSLKYFFSKYAPAGDQNDPNSYANAVAAAIGVNADTTPLNWIVANKLDAFAGAIKTHEGWFTY